MYFGGYAPFYFYLRDRPLLNIADGDIRIGTRMFGNKPLRYTGKGFSGREIASGKVLA